MTDLQNKYDMLLEDIKFLLQYDDKYIKIDKNNIVNPNKLNELEKQIGNIKQKQSGIKLQIKNNNDNKELITNEIRIINKKQNNIETEITELNNNTKIIQEEQQSKLDLINLKCKELDELCNLFTGCKCTIYVIQNINKKILSHINNINETGDVFQTFDNKSKVNSVAFSPDGKFVVSGSNSVKIWKIKEKLDNNFLVKKKLDNNFLVKEKLGHKSIVNSVAFSPDGNFIVSGSVSPIDNLIIWYKCAW